MSLQCRKKDLELLYLFVKSIPNFPSFTFYQGKRLLLPFSRIRLLESQEKFCHLHEIFHSNDYDIVLRGLVAPQNSFKSDFLPNTFF